MDSKLFTQAIIKFLSGLLIVGLLLFLPAGTFAWWQADLKGMPNISSVSGIR